VTSDQDRCVLYNLCERLGTVDVACSKAALSKLDALESARRKYGNDAYLVRLELIENDLDRLKACMSTLLLLMTQQKISQ